MKSLTTRKKMETKTKVKIIYLESRLDDVERELHSLPHKIHELEERRKNLLNKITELYDKQKEEKEVDTRVA
jgi:predicted transcriptional regulator